MTRCASWVLILTVLLGLAGSCPAAATVGVYYYPWWGAGQGGHTFDQTLRAHTTPEDQLAAVGDQYSSRDPDVISSHIDQSHLGNISMWSLSWWGPNRYEDVTIRDHILTHPRASELSYTIHYETGGRLGNFNSPNYSKLIPDFQYLAENIFDDPNYMRIDGRPVVVMYLSRVFFDDAAGWTALSDLRATMQQQYGYDPYIIGDHVFRRVAAGASHLDAITGFDVYGQVFNSGVVDRASIDRLEGIYSSAQHEANQLGIDFVPGAAPGFNDKGVRSGHAPAARYLSETGPGTPGSALTAMLEDAVLPHTDADINDLILVNSFNEWHEDTQIEASVITAPTTTDDTPSGSGLTVGRTYEGYGNRYLDIFREATQLIPGDFNDDRVVDDVDLGIWQGAFGINALGDADADGDSDGADFLSWQRNHGTGVPTLASQTAVPEPSGLWLGAGAFISLLGIRRSSRHGIGRAAVPSLPAVAEVAKTFGDLPPGPKLLASSATGEGGMRRI